MRSLGMNDIIWPHRATIVSIMMRAGINSLFVVGSVARGAADESSDVDFLLGSPLNIPHNALLQVKNELRTLLRRNVDLVFLDRLPQHIQRSLLEERVQIQAIE